MQSIQTSHVFPLTSVKPLEGLLQYRKFCLEATKKSLSHGATRRTLSPIDGTELEAWAKVDGLEYARCPKTGSLFLGELSTPERWAVLLEEISQYRHAKAFHKEIKKLRLENVYEPKRSWIENTLCLHGLKRPNILEITTPPSDFTSLLKEKENFGEVLMVYEMELALGRFRGKNVDCAILLESLDRVSLPKELLKNLYESLSKGGLLFVTALISSGFDMMVLGKDNAYLYPPDRANCFSLSGLKKILMQTGFHLVEVSTPGILDVEVVQSHLAAGISPLLSDFERQVMASDSETKLGFQKFLQQSNMSSFARIVAKKE